MKSKKLEDREDTKNEALLRQILLAFVIHPADLEIDTEDTGRGELITYRVNREDDSYVRGGAGRTAQAMRTIFQFIGARDRCKIQLMLLEPKVGERGSNSPMIPNYEWKSDALIVVLRAVLDRIMAKEYQIEEASAEDTTNVDITANRSEKQILDELLQHLQTVFHLIGKSDGRRVYLAAPAAIPNMEAKK